MSRFDTTLPGRLPDGTYDIVDDGEVLTRDYNEAHQPGGSPGGIGGQFAPKGEGSEAGASVAPPGSSGVPIGEPPEPKHVQPWGPEGPWVPKGSELAVPLDPAVTDVGGDKWNQELAVKLERQYQTAKPELEKIAADVVAKGEKSPQELAQEEPSDDEEPTDYQPESWGEIGDTKQEEIKNDWMEKTANEFLESEKQNWYENGDAMDQAKYELAYKGPDQQFVMDALNELREERQNARESEIPFDNSQLIAALSFDDFKTGYGGDNSVEMNWNDDKLITPKELDIDPLLPLPGVEPLKPSDKLTQEMRTAIEKKIVDAFNKEADDNVDKVEPPDYLSENVSEYQDQYWDGKSDKEKFEWAKDNGHIEDSEAQAKIEPLVLNQLPSKFDPLQEGGSDRDYKLTKLLANHMSHERAADQMLKRGIFDNRSQALRAAATFDNRLWTAWKGDSASTDGLLLQAATAAELGGRARGLGSSVVEDANNRFGSAGGWASMRAYVRGKWETTQWLLDKAGTPTVDLYRGILLKDKGKEEPVEVNLPTYARPYHYTKLPDVVLERNGAQSMTTDFSVANKWKGVGALAKGFNPEDDRVVLRARVPRTAVLSVPAYGQNLEGEREVVIAGTAWKKWDAWLNKAPTFAEAPV